MNRPLTNQQQAVYDFIREKIISRGYGPTVREIGGHMNIKSPNGVMCHLRALERKGMLTRTANKSRAIELTEPMSGLMGGSLPIQGSLEGGVCGVPPAPGETLPLAELTGGDRYALVVRDDALLDAQIRRGDWLIVERQSQATAGQLAIVRLGDGQRCLRYWLPEPPRIRLQPIGRDAPPTYVDQATVEGVVVHVMRRLVEPQPPPTPQP